MAQTHRQCGAGITSALEGKPDPYLDTRPSLMGPGSKSARALAGTGTAASMQL